MEIERYLFLGTDYKNYKRLKWIETRNSFKRNFMVFDIPQFRFPPFPKRNYRNLKRGQIQWNPSALKRLELLRTSQFENQVGPPPHSVLANISKSVRVDFDVRYNVIQIQASRCNILIFETIFEIWDLLYFQWLQ